MNSNFDAAKVAASSAPAQHTGTVHLHSNSGLPFPAAGRGYEPHQASMADVCLTSFLLVILAWRLGRVGKTPPGFVSILVRALAFQLTSLLILICVPSTVGFLILIGGIYYITLPFVPVAREAWMRGAATLRARALQYMQGWFGGGQQ